MSQRPMSAEQLHAYDVWDSWTRWFHWINAVAVMGLIIVGVILWNDDALGLSATGKIILKEIHVTLGYVMSLNLLWRFVWAFLGNRYARMEAPSYPAAPGTGGRLRGLRGGLSWPGTLQQYAGHNPDRSHRRNGNASPASDPGGPLASSWLGPIYSGHPSAPGSPDGLRLLGSIRQACRPSPRIRSTGLHLIQCGRFAAPWSRSPSTHSSCFPG